jgi:hypothetical protein
VKHPHIPEEGYLYVVYDSDEGRYTKEAVRSARSLKKNDRSAHISLVTNREADEDVFDNVIIRRGDATNWREGLAYKTKHVYETSPYQKTFFLDSDTFFYEDCSMLFNLLDYFDVCMSTAPAEENASVVDGKPLAGYIPYNTGVVLHKKNTHNEFLFGEWSKIFKKRIRENHAWKDYESDQTAFMDALLKSESRVYVLASVWNARIPFFMPLNGEVKIVHGRCKDYEALRARINSSASHRCWNPLANKCILHEPSRMKKLFGKVGLSRLLK